MTDASPRPGTPLGVWALLCSLVFVVLAVLVSTDHTTAIDTREILAVRRLDRPIVTVIMLTATGIAGGWISVVLALILAALIGIESSRRDAVLYAVTCLTGELLHLGLKELVRHHRPIGISPKLTAAGGYSFPSGHTMLAVIIFGLGAWLATRRASRGVRVTALSLAAAVTLLVGLSRVYLGAHWPSDVVAALCAGTAWSVAAIAWRNRRWPIAEPVQSP